ncbi:hypothetical protein [Alysiella crassa]
MRTTHQIIQIIEISVRKRQIENPVCMTKQGFGKAKQSWTHPTYLA